MQMTSNMPATPSIAAKRRSLAHFLRDKSGVSAVLIALMMPVLVGFVGLGIDAGMWYSRTREMQTVADSAAISAALTLLASHDENAAIEMGRSDAVRSGFEDSDGAIDVSIN